MAKTKKPVCKTPVQHEGDPPFQECGTHKNMTLCVGDRVQRTLKAFPHKGTVMAVSMGRDNRGRKQLAARVCLDINEPGDFAYPYLFSELRKLK